MLWIGTAGGLQRYDIGYVVPLPPLVPRLSARVYPNPARLTALGTELHLTGNTSDYRGDIYAIDGRRLHRFSHLENGGQVWDGRDDGGRKVPPGIYFLHVSAGGRSAVVRLVLLH
jgi:hypothetical protein